MCFRLWTRFVFGRECQHSKSFGGCGENLRFASDCGGFHAAASRDEGTRSAVGVGDIRLTYSFVGVLHRYFISYECTFWLKDFHLSCFGVSLRKKTNNTNNTRTTFLHVQRFLHCFLGISCVQKKNKTLFMSLGLNFVIHSSAPHVGLTGVDPTLSEPQKPLVWHSYRQICVEHICIRPDRLALNISAFLQTAFCGNHCGVHFDFNG